ncbi:MAG: SulP family inorganic anion transporter [Planctomycetota bacterium]|nr:MAG: SulP family inorganic anion transporter [Planctomycetota bacterium]
MSEALLPIPSGMMAEPTCLGERLGKDLFSGFLVFLIALPLCLGISLASGVPAVAGVLTAIVGSLVCALISDSELTIKGPAAGLIVIVLGAVNEFKGMGFDEYQAYRMMLAVGVASGVIQILFGLLRTGILGEFFPSSAVHGLLAAIGIIIISKQFHVAVGVMDVKGEPLYLLSQIPSSLLRMNPRVALIGGISLAVLFGLPLMKQQWVRRIPAQMVVIIVAMLMGSWMHFSANGNYTLGQHEYPLGEQFLVSVPANLIKALTSPDFRALELMAAWKWVLMFALIGSLESLLSAKAIDTLDPLKRKTNMNKDLLAIGVANTIAASLGGLPMISEIVRSKANIDNGARTRLAGVTHGLCILAFVALLPGFIHQIPMAALAAMLVYTGFRLASPKEFAHVAHIGREQLVIFVSTLIGVLATDLLIGIAIGIVVNFLFHLYHEVPLRSLFSVSVDVEHSPEGPCVIRTQNPAVFSNWIPLRSQIMHYGMELRNHVVVDLSQSHVVDHSVMEKLHSLQADFVSQGLKLEIRGLGAHQSESEHWLATRRLVLPKVVRLTVMIDLAHELRVLRQFHEFGGGESRITPCTVVMIPGEESASMRRVQRVQIEMLTSERITRMMLGYLSQEAMPASGLSATVEKVHGISFGARKNAASFQNLSATH